MKPVIIFALALTMLSMQVTGVDKTKLLCKKWELVATKAFKERTPKPVPADIRMCYIYHENGTFEIGQNDTVTGNGRWRFNQDQTMLGRSIEKMYGAYSSKASFIKTDILIVRLTEDTMILGDVYFDKELNLSGHNDGYYVPAH